MEGTRAGPVFAVRLSQSHHRSQWSQEDQCWYCVWQRPPQLSIWCATSFEDLFMQDSSHLKRSLVKKRGYWGRHTRGPSRDRCPEQDRSKWGVLAPAVNSPVLPEPAVVSLTPKPSNRPTRNHFRGIFRCSSYFLQTQIKEGSCSGHLSGLYTHKFPQVSTQKGSCLTHLLEFAIFLQFCTQEGSFCSHLSDFYL